MQQLTHLISTIGEFERKTEILRQVLAEQKNFEPYTAFRRLDKSRCGEVYQQDIKEFMDINGFTISNLEASYLFKFLDQNRDGHITYIDFVKQVLPKENLKLQQEAATRDSYFIEVNSQLPIEVEWGLFKLFEQETLNFSTIERLKNSLYKFSSIDLKETFSSIDVSSTGSITYTNLEKFLLKHGSPTTREDILAFFRTINESCKINIQEFHLAIDHFHPSQIMKDKERAYYSTPKKYRKAYDTSPIRSIYRYETNKSTSNLKSYQGGFIYTTPIRPNPNPSKQLYSTADKSCGQSLRILKQSEKQNDKLIDNEMEKEKQNLMLKQDFNLGKLYSRSQTKNLSFKNFCNCILPNNPPIQENTNVSPQTFSLMMKILQKQQKNSST